MKLEKGQSTYLTARKRKYLLITLIEFGAVASLLILGYTQTGTKLNLLTIIAILGCLPASKALVQFVVMIPYKNIAYNKYEEVSKKATLLTTAYDMLLTVKDKLVLLDAIVILDQTVCGYSSNGKATPEEVAVYIKDLLRENQLDKVTVKIFNDYTAFITRAEGLNNMALVERPETENKEERIRDIILSVSM